MRSLATLTAAALALLLSGTAFAQSTTQTLSGVLTGTTTLSANEVYLIDGEVYVDNGATLNIPAGTVLKGKQNPTTGNGQSSVLVVQRGGTLNARGTAAAPIIFTAEGDDVTDPFDTNETQRGLWGGVIILGNATNNRGVRQVEGIPSTDRSKYGCGDAGFDCDEDDDSGEMTYVSIRHAGFTLTPNAEINGLTLGSVGRGTLLEHIEVFANSDDSFEFFGGTVNAKYLVASFSGDDDIDWDQGYTGKLQFVFSLKDESGDVGRCIEGDGAASPFTAALLSDPVVSNLTCVGSGVGSTPGGSDAGGPTLKLRENTRGAIYNSVFTAVQSSAGGIDLEVQPEDDNGNPVGDATISTAQNFREGELTIANNIFFDFSVGNDAASIVRRDEADIEATIAAANQFVTPGLVNVADGSGAADDARDQDGVLDPRPGFGSAAASGADFTLARLSGDNFFTPVSFKGAFPATNQGLFWAAGWTALDDMLYFSANVTVDAEEAPEAAASALRAFPNPASGVATVALTLATAQEVQLTVVDMLGREVAVLASGETAAGETRFALPVADLQAGTYLVRLATEGAVSTQMLTVVR
ncbi:T9SS type A sorting domain-containing protein [Rubricoccus marinus]|uniref:Secretion system C-terminal sorting domain-containing protein n=1 Tax=Rubricoccus marinus TaxID=716817 RepID=A0A259TW61_9BACT|nr:T9SS type A sorting domain-containing protein [Rubricoccus marinus]OZC01857.1 hypothetical protein BSZ36_01945 [Rubricoccus marinus]